VTTTGEENVGGLDVAMEDALGVSGVESTGYVDGDLQQAIERQEFRAQNVLEMGAFQVLHDDVGEGVLRADFVDRADVGMVERGGRARLALEALEGPGRFRWEGT
jgi:hypothetical protein